MARSREGGRQGSLDRGDAWVDSDLVEHETRLLGSALRWVVEGLPDGGRALVVGHSPTNEAAVSGLVGQTIAANGKVRECSSSIQRPVRGASALATASGLRPRQLDLCPERPGNRGATRARRVNLTVGIVTVNN